MEESSVPYEPLKKKPFVHAPETRKYLAGLNGLGARELKRKIEQGVLLTEQTTVMIPKKKKGRSSDGGLKVSITPNSFSAIDMNGNKPIDGENYDGLLKHFMNFHSNLVKLASTLNTEKLLDMPNAVEYPKHAMSPAFEKGKRLLYMCLLALATGREISAFNSAKTEEKAAVLSVYLGTDLIVRAVQSTSIHKQDLR